MTNDDGRKPEGAPERAPKADVGAPSGIDGNGPKRFSVQRKMAIVARLLRGEPLELVARETNVSIQADRVARACARRGGDRPRRRLRGFYAAIQIAADPPSTNNSVPATKLESSDSRNNAALATSSAVPRRPNGTSDFRKFFTSSFANTSSPGVWIGPGLRTLTRMCRPFSSEVQLRAKERIAALVAL